MQGWRLLLIQLVPGFPTRIPTTMPVRLPNRAKLVLKSVRPPTSIACNIPPIKRTMPPIRTKSRASVSNGTCDAIFPTVETMEIGIFSSRV